MRSPKVARNSLYLSLCGRQVPSTTNAPQFRRTWKGSELWWHWFTTTSYYFVRYTISAQCSLGYSYLMVSVTSVMEIVEAEMIHTCQISTQIRINKIMLKFNILRRLHQFQRITNFRFLTRWEFPPKFEKKGKKCSHRKFYVGKNIFKLGQEF